MAYSLWADSIYALHSHKRRRGRGTWGRSSGRIQAR